MKKIKNIVLTLLLFSFGFIVVHDYAMQSLETKAQNTISCSKAQSAAEGSRVLIHECIHMLLAFLQPKPPLFFLDSPKSRPLYSKLQPTSHIRHVLERPPLS
ncbi:MAG: hypothetical protein IBX43_10415 [Campylobacterales bacterium]|nr:hypothetical protein [Campylobacterales bacterium]